jgi:hypothetical protein
MSVDAHGFIANKTDLGFQFASQNSALTLHNGKNVIGLHSTKIRQDAHQYFSSMTGDDFKKAWFDAHDSISDLIASGYTANRLTTLVIFYEPTSTSVEGLFRN